MAFGDNLKDKISQMSGTLQAKISQFKNTEFANASMAMCALVAAADGNIDASERKKPPRLSCQTRRLRYFQHPI